MTPTTPDPQLGDPLIDEVRRIREEISREHDGDMMKLFEELRRLQDQHRERVVRRTERTPADR